MKKVKFTGKFNLGKETISNLSNDQMNEVNGGATILGFTCCAGSWNHSSCGGHICISGKVCYAPTNDTACNPNG
jgi:hypothetical protein